jgi:L-ribulose-5-phosphate 4-epimerase
MDNEGYIKFKCLRDKTDCINADDIIDLIYWRNILREKKLLGVLPGGIGFGNISKGLSKSEFIITGSRTGGEDEPDTSHFAKVTGWDFEKNEVRCSGLTPASSESLSHAAIYDSDKNAKAVVHTHNERLWEKMKDKYPTTPEYAEFGTPELAKEIIRLFKSHVVIGNKIIILGGHREGILTFGSTLEEAVKILLGFIKK